ncbi:alpha/beta fold hydrolase [Variovorax robiniae]|uniref:Alpha/beta fold hydrolase n=1 Tax=Variovorax robiniae TaxID=1836199 RepID=A0ABU8X5Q0_9BURK
MTTTSTSASPAAAGLPQQIHTQVERAIQRGLKGLDYLGSPAPAVGTTPKTVLHRRGTLTLQHYHPTAAEVYRMPILIVMATSNKAFMLDLAPGRSLIEFLLGRGYDVYVMDWNAPSKRESGLRLEDYTLDFIPDCLRRVQQHAGVDDVTLIGYCMGGVLSTIYAALHADGPVKNLVGLATPIDFSKIGFKDVMDRRYFDVDKLVDSVGLIPPKFIETGFELLRPAGRMANAVRLWDNMWNDEYVQSYRLMERWGAETLPMAGEYFRQLTKELFWKNGLCESTLSVGGRPVRLDAIRASLLSVVAAHDHLVPPECARPLVDRIGSSDKQELVLPGGHVSLVAGPNAVKRLWPRLDQWLESRST